MKNRNVFYLGHYKGFELFSKKHGERIGLENLYYAPSFPNGPIYNEIALLYPRDKINELPQEMIDSILIIGQGRSFSVKDQGKINPIANKLFSISTEEIFNEHWEDYFPVQKIIEEKYSRFSLMEID